MKEIDSATHKGLLSDAPLYSEVLKHLPYYSACVRETLRLIPPGPSIWPRYVSAPGLDLYGKLAPTGAEIAANAWLVNRDRELYGADADEFHPERWLDPERMKLYNKYNFTFGYGTRACLGQDLAMMELSKAPLQ
ncbi:cytochrome P450, partial [Aspergillus californicus]